MTRKLSIVFSNPKMFDHVCVVSQKELENAVLLTTLNLAPPVMFNVPVTLTVS